MARKKNFTGRKPIRNYNMIGAGKKFIPVYKKNKIDWPASVKKQGLSKAAPSKFKHPKKALSPRKIAVSHKKSSITKKRARKVPEKDNMKKALQKIKQTAKRVAPSPRVKMKSREPVKRPPPKPTPTKGR